MHEPWVASAIATLSIYGYPLLLAAAVAENVFVVGLLVPGDLVVLIGGMLAEQGILNLLPVLACAAAGSIVGANLSYFLGARGGSAFVVRWGARVGLGPSRLAAAEQYFRDHGRKTVFLASFVAGIKNLIPVVAGASRMSFGGFLFWSTMGCSARVALGVGLGYVLGANLPRALEVVRAFNWWTVVAFVLVVLAAVAIRRRRSGGPSH